MCDNGRECAAAKAQGFAGPGADRFVALGAEGAPAGVAVRPSRPADLPAILAVHRSAFETDAEAHLVEALIASGDAVVSLVAVENAMVAGHVLLSTVSIEVPGESKQPLSLAPVAVRPESQRIGIGSRLVEASLQAARDAGWPAVIVLGHPDFYPRFGFVPAVPLGILPPWPDVPEEAWMVAELSPGWLDGVSGTVAFPPPFDEVM
jgi:putative acetyltransferase